MNKSKKLFLVRDGSRGCKYILCECLPTRSNGRIWKATKGKTLPGPMPNWIDKVSEIKVWDAGGGSVYDLRIPSFSLINKAMQLAISKSGIGAVMHPASKYY